MWGPFELESIGRLQLSTRAQRDRVEISTDGQAFKPLAEFPDVVRAIERSAQVTPARRPTIPPGRPPTIPPGAPAPAVSAPTPVTPVEEPVGPPPEGSLTEHSALELYARVAEAQLTGRLTLAHEKGSTALWFKRGAPERVEPPHAAQELALFLLRRRAAPESEVMSALEVSGGPDGEFLDAIFALGLVPSENVFQLLGEHQVEQLDRVLLATSGAFAWEPEVRPPAGSFPLGPRWALLSGFVRRQPPSVVRQRLGDRLRRNVYRSSAARASESDLKLTAQETRIAAMLDGSRTAEQLLLASPEEGEAIARVTWLLGEVGGLSFGALEPVAGSALPVDEDQVPVVERSAPAAKIGGEGSDAAILGKVAVRAVAVKATRPTWPPQAAPVIVAPPSEGAPGDEPAPPPAGGSAPRESHPPSRAPNGSAPREPHPPSRAPNGSAPKQRQEPLRGAPGAAAKKPLSLDEERALLEKWAVANHFEVLGVSPKATAAEVKTAYFTLAKKHHPDSAIAGTEEEKTLKADLTARLNEAYSVLNDDAARAEYAAALSTGDRAVDVGPLLEAEEQFMRATILVKARKYAEGLDLLERAIALNPDEGEFYAWRGFAHFAQAVDKRAQFADAFAECQRGLKLNPRCAQAHLFIGQMAKVVGDLGKAEAAFRAVLGIDPENIDARRELRTS